MHSFAYYDIMLDQHILTMEMTLTSEELKRYHRHIIIPELNIEGQKKLKTAKVLVIGAGGLGCATLQYLVAAGIGKIGIVDYDHVSSSNLQRQVLYGTQDVGFKKVDVAIKKLSDFNPFVAFEAFPFKLDSQNALDLFSNYDIIVDGTDNFPTRYLINDASIITQKVNIHASIDRFEGQISVFNYIFPDHTTGPNYRDLFPEPPDSGTVRNCAEAGVIGVLPGIIGCLQANEVIKIITGLGEPLVGKLFRLDALSLQSTLLKFSKDPNNPITGDTPSQKGLVDYKQFCGYTAPAQTIKSISALDLENLILNKEEIQIIDVREHFEYETENIGGDLIPLNDLEHHVNLISKTKKVIIHCKSGSRSKSAISFLQNKYGFDNLYTLKGGILEWNRVNESK